MSKVKGAFVLILLILGSYYFNLLRPVDWILYDSQIRLADRKPLDDIVIIAIDKQSLDKLGRWPWSRNIHGDLIKKISQATPSSIVLDIIFSEPSVPEHDEYLAEAIAENGKVILPVAPELGKDALTLVQNLPIESLRNAAAGIGHVDRELDFDAVTRRSFLYAGLSKSTQWPSIALQAILIADYDPQKIDQEKYISENNRQLTANTWKRSNEYLLPYAGKPGTFERIPYFEVLEESFDLKKLNNKFVLIGATAYGLGDVVSTVVSGESRPMPGIEVVANELDSLIQGLMIKEIDFWPGLILTCIIVLAAFFLWDFLSPSYNLICGTGMIVLVVLFNTCVLHYLRIWFPPANLIIGICLGYLGWTWGSLVETAKYLNSEISRLGDISKPLIEINHAYANDAFEFLMNIDGFYYGSITDDRGITLFEWKDKIGSADLRPLSKSPLTTIKTQISRNEDRWILYLSIDEEQISKVDARGISFLLAKIYSSKAKPNSKTPTELIRNRIGLVKRAYSRVRFLNHFMGEVLDQLYNGVVVTDVFGNIVMANKTSEELLGCKLGQLRILNVLDVLKRINFQKQQDWYAIFSNIMFKKEKFIAEANTTSGVYLVEATRYGGDEISGLGMVFNFIEITTLKETEQSRRDLLVFLSHDLRSPLASLIATSDLARLRPEYRDSDTFVSSIQDNARRALQMADEFLTLIRAESITVESFEKVDFNQIVNNSIKVLEGSVSRKNIVINKKIDITKQYHVSGSSSVLERVVINLLTNAVKYSSENSTVEVGLECVNNEVHYWVKDNGNGIREEDKEKIFHKFQRLQNKENFADEGVGLGLAFVKSSVTRHHGSIHLESRIGEGSCFNIYLPLLTSKADLSSSVSIVD